MNFVIPMLFPLEPEVKDGLFKEYGISQTYEKVDTKGTRVPT